MILGHAYPAVTEAIYEAACRGTSYGATTEREIIMAEMIVNAFPSIDMVRMVNSGTEATMSAIRLARAYTGRERIIKFEGCYHGHADPLLVRSGSGIATLGIPGSPGVPKVLAELTITVPYNDVEALKKVVNDYGSEIACLIVEPVAGNMGIVLPVPHFLDTIREITREKGIILIFDEVITGFRLAYGGMQTIAGIEPDLTCLGKIIGGGLPVGVFGGKRQIMEMLAPTGPVYQAGTLSGNPLAMAAGVATLKILRSWSNLYHSLDVKTNHLCNELKSLLEKKGLPFKINRAGSLFTIFFTSAEVKDFRSAQKADTGLFSKFFRGILSEGIYSAPSQFESSFLSAAHSDDDIERTIDAVSIALKNL
jgi:glutamate-1-semialdehyde 2,1-aminomutase